MHRVLSNNVLFIRFASQHHFVVAFPHKFYAAQYLPEHNIKEISRQQIQDYYRFVRILMLLPVLFSIIFFHSKKTTNASFYVYEVTPNFSCKSSMNVKRYTTKWGLSWRPPQIGMNIVKNSLGVVYGQFEIHSLLFPINTLFTKSKIPKLLAIK